MARMTDTQRAELSSVIQRKASAARLPLPSKRDISQGIAACDDALEELMPEILRRVQRVVSEGVSEQGFQGLLMSVLEAKFSISRGRPIS